MADNDSTGTDSNGKAPHPPGFLIDVGPKLKKCKNCGERKPLDQFNPQNERRNRQNRNMLIGITAFCKKCGNERNREWCKKNRERVKESSAQSRKRNLEKYKSRDRATKLKVLFGITVDRYDTMFIDQNGSCAICLCPETTIDRRTGGVKRLAVDHVHDERGKVRALLCAKCNAGLGLFKDDPDLLRAAADYIERFREPDE